MPAVRSAGGNETLLATRLLNGGDKLAGPFGQRVEVAGLKQGVVDQFAAYADGFDTGAEEIGDIRERNAAGRHELDLRQRGF